MVRIHYFAVMVTVMQFLQIFLWISSRRTKKSIYKRKKEYKSANEPFIAVLKKWFSNKKLVTRPEVTLIPNFKDKHCH